MMNRTRIMLISGALLTVLVWLHSARAQEGEAPDRNLVKQANAPISSILQIRLQDTWQPEFYDLRGSGNVASVAVTMPFPEHRLIPLPQLSVLTIPAAVTPPGGATGFGDLKFVDIAVFRAGENAIWGIGPTFVFPTASHRETGQGKWQIGPAAAIAYFPRQWLLGLLVQNPISFAGDHDRRDVNLMILQPFLTYQFSDGWFVRSQPQIGFNWRNGKQVIPLDLGVGRVFTIGRQKVNCYVEPFWNTSHDGPAPQYGITFGMTFLYPDFWKERN